MPSFYPDSLNDEQLSLQNQQKIIEKIFEQIQPILSDKLGFNLKHNVLIIMLQAINGQVAAAVQSLESLVKNVTEVNLFSEHEVLIQCLYDSLLRYACCFGDLIAVKKLAEKGVNINAKSVGFDEMPLHIAARKGHHSVVRYLLTIDKTNVNQGDISGNTPLIFAAAEGHLEVVKVLIKEGNADASMADSAGQSPLTWATEDRHFDVAEYLKEVLAPPVQFASPSIKR